LPFKVPGFESSYP